MLEMKMVDYVEKTNEKIFFDYCNENEVICWGKILGKHGVMERFNNNCSIGRRYVSETKNHQENLDYWLTHLDKYNRLHKASIEAGDMKPNDIRKELNYYIRKVQLIEDGKIIKEETFRYGR